MIVKSLSTITKCARTSLQTPSQINQFVTRTLVSGVDDIVRVGKNIKTIKFNEFTNILKRNGLDDFVTQEDFINFVRFNQNNKNLAQMLDDPKALTTFFQRSRKMVETAKSCDEDIYKVLKNGFTEINDVDDLVKPENKWVHHCIFVSLAAERIAKYLNLDSDYAKSLALIHDIGRKISHPNHVIEGYNYMVNEIYLYL